MSTPAARNAAATEAQKIEVLFYFFSFFSKKQTKGNAQASFLLVSYAQMEGYLVKQGQKIKVCSFSFSFFFFFSFLAVLLSRFLAFHVLGGLTCYVLSPMQTKKKRWFVLRGKKLLYYKDDSV